jgi:AbrB family looped-hinge helix DNA binding protein
MPTTRISPKHQITIPKEVFEAAELEVGDLLDATVEDGKVIFAAKRPTDEVPVAGLRASEQRALERARKKIKAINEDVLNSRGLTRKEIQAAIRARLIAKDQAYFWTEEWQKDIRASERDVRAGRLSPPAETAEELMAQLNRLKQA